ncbi:ATP-binding protein [Flexivirga caeni]|uniref:ATP-binding protein n=1 Tax=Flexivirga caeni TaxID=2294115 RepID=UPI00131508EF|nr:BTAD domain-containing putative transcriptional regulator [Flexivirga caeni]
MNVRLVLLPEVSFDGRPITSAAIGRLVACLAADLRTGAGSARLIEDLWPDDRPEHPAKALQVVVSRTRSALGAGVVESTPGGYRLLLAEDEVDATALRARATAARRALRECDAAGALEHADAGLALWPDVADTDPDPDDPLTTLRCDALAVRTTLTRERGLALARLGRHADALEALAPYLTRMPHDEEVLATVLRAEAVTGSRAAALERYETYRRSVRDRLGTDPGAALQQVHLELLETDRPQVHTGVEHDPNPLLGRDRDLEAVAHLVGTSRVTSIVGPGGLGKTRLAHAVCRQTLYRTVQFVGLAGVTDSSEVAAEVATVLGVTSARTRAARTTEAPVDLATAIARSLGGVSALLVLDNCEHVLDGVVELTRSLVAVLPDLRILTTSRAPLGLSSETVYPLAELDLDTAAELFTQRARAVRPDVELPEDVIRRLCARLDGLPLALELAAARTNVLSVRQIEQRLEHRFALLNRGARDAPDRHRTLQAVIDWSWRLLGSAEQEALATLSVFADGFDLDAAGDVLAAGGPPTADPVEIVEQLVDQSLLQRADRDGRPRFRMLETVREFGTDQLAHSGRTTTASRAVLRWATAVSRTRGPQLFGPDPDDALHFLLAEEDNLTAALRAALDGADAAATAAVFGALGSLWSVQSRHERVFDPASDAVRVISHYHPGAQDLEITRQALVLAAVNLNIVGNPTGLRALVLLRRLPPAATSGIVEALARLLMVDDGMLPLDADRAIEVMDRADPALRAATMLLVAHVLENDGRADEALQVARTAETEPAIVESPWGTLVNRTRVAELAAAVGDYVGAEETAARAIPLLERFGAQGDLTSMRWTVAMLRLQRADVAGATEQLQAAGLPPAEDSFGEGTTGMTIHAELDLAEGNVEAGLRRYRAAVEHAERRSSLAPFLTDESTSPWLSVARSASLVAHAIHDRLDEVADLPGRLTASLRAAVTAQETGPLSMVIRVDLPICGCAVLGLSYALAMSGTSVGERACAARGFALSEALGVSRTSPAFALQRARALAIQTDAPAYDSARETYAGAGRDELLKLLGQWLDALPHS